MTGVGPVAGLEQHRLQQPDLDYLTGHTVDFNPVAHADSIPSHQDEPPEERNDEILHGNGQPRARQAENGRSLRRHSNNDEQYEQCAHRLSPELHHRPQCVDALVLRRKPREQAIDHAGCNIEQEQNQHYG